MTSVTVVTRNAALEFSLGSAGFETVDIRPDRYNQWVDRAGATEADVIVLELDDPIAAAAGVGRLRQAGMATPILIVSSARPGWQSLTEQQYSAVEVLPLPLTMPAMTAAIERLLAGGPADLSQQSDFETPARVEVEIVRVPVAETESGPEPVDTIPSGLGWPSEPGASVDASAINVTTLHDVRRQAQSVAPLQEACSRILGQTLSATGAAAGAVVVRVNAEWQVIVGHGNRVGRARLAGLLAEAVESGTCIVVNNAQSLTPQLALVPPDHNAAVLCPINDAAALIVSKLDRFDPQVARTVESIASGARAELQASLALTELADALQDRAV